MKIPRSINGADFADHLIRHWQYVEVHQTGSHIVLRTQTPSGHTLSVPAHKPLKLGTFTSILRGVAAHKNVSKAEILKGL